MEGSSQAAGISGGRRSRQGSLALMGGIVLIGAALYYFGWWGTALSISTPAAVMNANVSGSDNDAAQFPLVRVAPVHQGPVPIYLSAIGTVQAYNTVAVKTRVDGQIAQVLFKEGQDVKEGDPLVIIDQRSFQAQLNQQVASLQKDEAGLAGAILDMKRYDGLVDQHAVSQQQVDRQHALVDQQRAQVNIDKAQIDYARTQLDYTTIRAPINGRVGIRMFDQGNFVHSSDQNPILVITQLQPISGVFTVASSELEKTKLSLGQVKVPIVALGQDSHTEFDRGTVDMVDNQVDQTTGTIKLKASFPNEQLKLWPGDFIYGRMTLTTMPTGLTIPAIALRHGPRSDFVWIVRPDNTVRTVNVVAGQVADDEVLIVSGLMLGERVVTEGYYRLENGAQVRISGNAVKASSSG